MIVDTSLKTLNEALKKIKSLALVKENVFSEEDLEVLKATLNGSLPKTDADRAQARLVRYLSDRSPAKAYELFSQSGAPGLILWMDSRAILQRLRLRKLVFLQWDKKNDQFIVEKYVPLSVTHERVPQVDV